MGGTCIWSRRRNHRGAQPSWGSLLRLRGKCSLSAFSLPSGNHLLLSFQVSKKYSDIEEFYTRNFAVVRQPACLPRKVLLLGEGDIQERRALFDEILRCIRMPSWQAAELLEL